MEKLWPPSHPDCRNLLDQLSVSPATRGATSRLCMRSKLSVIHQYERIHSRAQRRNTSCSVDALQLGV